MDHQDKRARIHPPAAAAAASQPVDAAAAEASAPVMRDYFPQYSADALKAALKGTIELERRLVQAGTTEHDIARITSQGTHHREMLIQSHLDCIMTWGYDREKAVQLLHDAASTKAAEEAKRTCDAMEQKNKEQGAELGDLTHKLEQAQQQHKEECKRLTYEALEAQHKLQTQEKEAQHKLQTQEKRHADLLSKHRTLATKTKEHLEEMEALQARHKCVICKDRPRDCVFDECNHFASCMQCAEGLKACPCCQAHIGKNKKRKVFCS
jgi:hypothetical protein